MRVATQNVDLGESRMSANQAEHATSAKTRPARIQVTTRIEAAGRDPCDGQAGVSRRHSHQVGGRRLALGVGVGGDDDLVTSTSSTRCAAQQFADPQRSGKGSGSSAAQDVIATELAGALDPA